MPSSEKSKSVKPWLDALVLMRIPFSIYLMPIFWLAAYAYPFYDTTRAVITFLILHILLYPASNGYNSYHDKDDAPVGGLANPPKVNQELWYLTLLFDAAALISSWFLGTLFFLMVLTYWLASKAYTWPRIRLKADALMGTATVVLFQGAHTFYMVLAGLGLCSCEYAQPQIIGFAIASSLVLLGNYPLTQVYQHNEDAKNGDQTVSLRLGIEGTFKWATFWNTLGGFVMGFTLYYDHGWPAVGLVLLGQIPAEVHFRKWKKAAIADPTQANHANAMKMNKLASLGFSTSLILGLILYRLFAIG